MNKFRKIVCLLLVLSMMLGYVPAVRAAEEVAIDETNFPDENFRTYVLKNCDSDGNGVLSEDEALNVTEILVYNRGIYSLKGIEYFTALTRLRCDENQLTELDVSRNTALESLSCGSNQLTSLDISKNTALKNLYCDSNQLTELDISRNTALQILECYSNQLTSLNISGCASLTQLSCSFNQLTSLDVSGCTSLTSLGCSDNQLTKLDVSGCTSLTVLSCSDNQLSSLNVSGCTSLTDLYCYETHLASLDVSNKTALQRLECYSNQLISLNASGCTSLMYLHCYDNQLIDLNVSGCTSLTLLECRNNQLTRLDVSDNEALTELLCDYNQLTALDVSQNPALRKLSCVYNQLTGLELSGNAKLQYLCCNYNQLRDLDVSKNSSLSDLGCRNNQLMELDVSKNTALTGLDCDSNQLTKLDVSKNTALGSLYCRYNLLTKLDVSQNTALVYLMCDQNQLTELDLGKNTGMIILSCENNQLTSLDVSSCASRLISFGCFGNEYPLDVAAGETFDLTTLPGSFDVSKASNWSGGSVSGTTLTVSSGATKVTYTYDCGGGKSGTFTLLPKDGGSGSGGSGIPYSQATAFCGTFAYGPTEFGGEDQSYTFAYDDNLFFNSSYTYQHELTKMSMRVALAAYDTNDGNGNLDKAANILKLMDALGYNTANAKVDYPVPDTNTIGSAISHKNIVNAAGKKCTVVLVAVRGGGYGEEWGGNFLMGTGMEHQGFYYAAEQVMTRLEEYINTNRASMDPEIKIWISSYSRGAATSNLVAAMLDEGRISGIKPENVFAFCFECPKNTTNSNRSSSLYSNIVNIVNPIDIVTKVAPEFGNFQFNRYGKTYYVPSRMFDVGYAAKKVEATAHYAAILNHNGMSTTDASWAAVANMAEGMRQESVFAALVDSLALLGHDRQHYVNSGMEAAIVTLTRNTLGGGEYTAETAYWLIQDLYKIATSYKLGTVSSAQATAAVALMGLDSCLLLMKAHYPERCMAWLDSLDGNLKTGPITNKVYINCPVDVSVYDSENNLVAQIINDEVQEIEDGLSAFVDFNEQKILYLPDDGDYRVEVTATGEGEMTYTVEELDYDSGTSNSVTSYYDIPITEGDTLSGTVLSTEDTYPLSHNGETLEPSIRQEGEEVRTVTVTVSAAEGGSVYGDGDYLLGTFVKVCAEPDEGYAFSGWYSGGELISAEISCRFRVEEEISLEARFKRELSIPEKPYKIVNVVSGVHVYWNKIDGVSKYGLWRSETGKDGTYKWIANPTVPHFTDTKVESGKTYWYKVTSLDTDANVHSEKSEAIGLTYVSTPDITLRVNRAVGIGLRWDKVEGATGYAIYRKSYSGTDAWVRVATISGGDTLSWDDTSVKNNNGEVYRYTIRALTGANRNTLSGCRSTGRTMVRLTSRPLNSAVKTGTNSIKVTWGTTSQATGYEVRFMVDGEVYKTYTIGNYKTGAKTFTDLPAGTYKIQVRTYKKVEGVGSFYSAWSTAKTVTLG